MRLVKCAPTTPEVWVICHDCREPLKHSDAWADLDGPPFVAYYHPHHKPEEAVTNE